MNFLYKEDIINTKFIGKGPFTRCYRSLGNAQDIFFKTITQVGGLMADISKPTMAMINKHNGKNPHIPPMEEIGEKYVRGITYTLYKSEWLFPLRRREFPNAFRQYQILKEVEQKVWDAYPEEEKHERTGCVANYIPLVMEVLKGKEVPDTLIDALSLIYCWAGSHTSSAKLDTLDDKNFRATFDDVLVLNDAVFNVHTWRKLMTQMGKEKHE